MEEISAEKCQNEAIDANKLITVQIDNLPKFVLVRLNFRENLSNIRASLKRNSKIKMNDALSFAKKIKRASNNTVTFAEVSRADEKEIILEKIIENKSDIFLYLRSEIDWTILINKHKLEFGHSTTL